MEKGILPLSNELETILMKVEMGDESRKDFHVSFENNTKIYLTQCLTFAHSNNTRFQNYVQKYFDEMAISISGVKYQSAPVKLYNRCVVKATSDYQDREFPSVANIIDFLRFSVTFNTIEDLLKGINLFVDDINSGNNEHLKEIFLPNGILRIKNGFSDIITSWKSYKDAEYCDIKLNLIYVNNNQSPSEMIVEGQFLLKFLLQAKKMGHKLYSLIRQDEFISNVKNQIYNIDENYDQYKLKINKLIDDRDTNNLTKQLFWKPNIVLSIINIEKDTPNQNDYYPLFYSAAKQLSNINSKFLVFFFSCLFHLSCVLCNEENNENNRFLKLYFNWNQFGNRILCFDEFYGLSNYSNFKSNGIAEMIIKQRYFNAFSQLTKSENIEYATLITPFKNTIYWCTVRGNYVYLELLLKYALKTRDWIRFCFKSRQAEEHNNNGEKTLIALILNKSVDLNEKIETIKIYIQLCDKYGAKGAIYYKTIQKVYGYLVRAKTDDSQEAVSIIEKYCKKHYHHDLSLLDIEDIKEKEIEKQISIGLDMEDIDDLDFDPLGLDDLGLDDLGLGTGTGTDKQDGGDLDLDLNGLDDW